MKTIAIAVLLAAAPAAAGEQKEAVSQEAPAKAPAGLVKGDRVDVLVTFDAKMVDKDKKERKEKITASILQNVVVINVSKPAKLDEPGVVELLLNPNEAQYAALSTSQGIVSITVRAPGDTELHPMEMASFRKLIK